MTATPRWLLLALGVSVTLNLVGLGWIVGRSTAGGAYASTLQGVVLQRTENAGDPSATRTAVGRTVTLRSVPPAPPVEVAAPVPPVVAAEVPDDVSRGLQWIVATLPPDRRDNIAIEIDARAEPLLEETEKVFVIREQIREELSRSEFEKQRLESALARLREQIVMIQADSHRILADVAAELSEEEREALAASLASSLAERARGAREAALAAEAERLVGEGNGAIRVYRQHFVLEHEPTEEATPPD
jgi:uncharacterized membrane protein